MLLYDVINDIEKNRFWINTIYIHIYIHVSINDVTINKDVKGAE